jgi:hypothetical protein
MDAESRLRNFVFNKSRVMDMSRNYFVSVTHLPQGHAKMQATKISTHKTYFVVRFEVLATGTMRSTVYLVVMPCSLEKGPRFEGIYCLHPQDRKLKQTHPQYYICFIWTV